MSLLLNTKEELLKQLPTVFTGTLSGFTFEGYETADAPIDVVYLAESRADVSQRSLGRVGGRRRDESIELALVIVGGGLTVPAAEVRALAAFDVIEGYLQANPSLDGKVTGLTSCLVEGYETQAVDSQFGPICVVDVRVQIRGQHQANQP